MTEPPASDAIHAADLRFRWPSVRGGAPFSLRLPAWRVARGARVALYGPSGCGKSTLLDLIAGALTPEAGRLVVEGADLGAMSERARRAWRIRTVGFVFQDFPLVSYLDALENALLPYRLNPALRLDAAARERAAWLLDRLGLGDKLRRRPGQLSQGERQRAAIARALVTDPALLLADEPTAGLDPGGRDRVMALLTEIADERALTMVVVTHDPALRERFSDGLDVELLSAAQPSAQTSPPPTEPAP